MKALSFSLFLLLLFQSALPLESADSLLYEPIRRKILVKGDQYYPPYEFINAEGEPDGFNVELFREIAKELNFEYELQLEPWAAVRQQLEAGEIDIITGMMVSPARAQELEFGLPHSVMTFGIFTHATKNLKTLEELRGKEVIVQDGDLMHDYLLETGLTTHIITVSDQLEGLELINRGQYDAALMSNFQGAYLLKKHKLNKVVVRTSSIEPRRYAMAGAKGNEELIRTLNMGLFQLKTKGTYDRLYNKWFQVYESGYQFKRLRPWLYGGAALLLFLGVVVLIMRQQIRRTVRRLGHSEKRYSALIEVSPVGMGVVNGRTIVEAGSRLCELFGYREEDFIGQDIGLLHFTKEEDERVGRVLNQMVAERGQGMCETTLKHKDGTPIDVIVYSALIDPKDPNSLGFFTCTDISALKQARREQEKNEERLRSMLNLMQQKTAGIKELLDFALDEAIKQTDSALGFINTYNYKTEQFETVSMSGKVMDECKLPPQRCFELENSGFWGEAVRQRKGLFLNDFKAVHPLKIGYPEGHVEIEKYLTLPVISDKEVVVVVGLANKKEDYTERDILNLSVLMDTVWRMIEKKKADDQLARLSHATQHSPVSVIITDTKGRIEFANARFIETSGYSFDELEGHVLRVLRPNHTPEPEFTKMWAALRAGSIWRGEHQNSNKSGTPYWQSYSISALRDKQGTITNYVVVSEDITQDKQLQLELVTAKEKAEESDRLKTAFLNNLSHEVRTPLNAIVGFSEFMTDEALPDDKRALYSRTIIKSSNQLLSLMDNIINMALLESGQAKVQKKQVGINQLLNDVYNQIQVTAAKPDITLRVNSQIPRNSDEVLLDQTKVVQILFNLLSNAYKFTRKGLIQFGCRLKNNQLEFFVEDSGVGFPAEKRALLFEKFHQGSNSITGLKDGMGLGLALTQSYLKLLGGTFDMESEPNEGTTIRFRLPYEPATAETAAPLVKENIELQPKATLLVADDVQVNQIIIQEMLDDQDITTLYASNGQEAIDMVQKHPEISVVLMDVKMPVMSGYEATAAIKKLRPDLPVIAQTAYALSGDKDKALAAGCDDYLSKPIKREALLRKLNLYLNREK